MSIEAETAIARARSVHHYYRAIYPDGDAIESALDKRHPPSAVEPFYTAALNAADNYGVDDDRCDALYRAADSAEAAWLALHPVIDTDAFDEAMTAAERGRGRINMFIEDPVTGEWK